MTNTSPAGKQCLTIDEVRAQYPERRWDSVDLTNDDGTVTTIAFRNPRLSEVKQLLKQKEMPQVGDMEAAINLLAACCLTHDRIQLAALIENDVGVLNEAIPKLMALTTAGVSSTKKG